MTHGWVPSYRKMYEPGHWLAPTKRDPSCRRDAWSDLFHMATRKPRQTPNSGTIEKGELVASLRTLGDRWKWSKDRVKRFMSDLEVRTAIETVRETPDGTVYRIVNYDTYAILQDSERDTESDSERDRGETEARQEQQVTGKTTTYTSDFQELWDVRKRGSRKKAFDQYYRARKAKGAEHDVLLEKWEAYVKAARSPEYVAHMWRWLRDERWEEDVPTPDGEHPVDENYVKTEQAKRARLIAETEARRAG